ncbi:MAG: hypothetical protein HYR94_06895 [Chloroflexi bacterium]|nr:hypothetical protein [Chloroflexota bacterium]
MPVLFLLYGVSIVFGFLSRELRLLNIISLITTQRVIEVRGVLSKTVLDTSLEKITDVMLRASRRRW